jgi:filamentous hemagglutinin
LNADADQWKEGGAYRAGAHAAIGLLAGGVSGALGAAASSALMPDVAEQIKKLGLPTEVQSVVSLAAAAGIGAAVGGSTGAASAYNVDLNNRQLHLEEKELAKKLAQLSGGKYTVEQIEAQMRGMDVRINGKIEIGLPDTVIGGVPSLDSGGTWLYAGNTADGVPIITQQIASEDTELRAFIAKNTTASSSLITYIASYAEKKPSLNKSQLTSAPEGTQRIPRSVDGAVYFPLMVSCPAASCMNGDPIAEAIQDAETRSYLDAVARKGEKDFTLATSVLGMVGYVVRAARLVSDLGDASAVANGANNSSSNVLRSLDQLVPGGKIPSVRNGAFNDWYNQLSPQEFDRVWAVREYRDAIQARIRQPGGLHEWLPVSQTDKFKSWEVSMEDIKAMRTLTKEIEGTNPYWVHGGEGSTTAHNEMIDLVNSSSNFTEYKFRLQIWADKRLLGGRSALPEGLRN